MPSHQHIFQYIRRRTTQQIKDEKEEAELKKADTEAKLARMEALMQRCQELEEKANDNESANLILRDMISKNEVVVDDQGNCRVVRETPDHMEGVSQSSEQP